MPYILNAKARIKLKHKLHDMCINLCNHLRENHILIQRGITEKVNKRGKVVGIKPVWDLPVCACYCSANDINAEGYSHRMHKCHQLQDGAVSGQWTGLYLRQQLHQAVWSGARPPHGHI